MHDICFDWEEFPNERSGEYFLDFNSDPPRPFKTSLGITLYRGGPLEINSAPYRDPARANRLRTRFGLDFRLLSECGDVTFFTGDWEPVRKSSIITIPGMFLLDYEHRVALTPHYHAKIVYYSRYAWPCGGAEINARVVDRTKAKAKKLKWALQDALRLGHTYYAMDGRHEVGLDIESFMAGFLNGRIDLASLTPDKNPRALWQLGLYVANRWIDRKINYWAEKPIKVTQLRFKLK